MSKQERCWEYGDKSKWAQHLLRSMSVAYLSIDVGAIGRNLEGKREREKGNRKIVGRSKTLSEERVMVPSSSGGTSKIQ